MVIEAFLDELRSTYPTLGFRKQVFNVCGTKQLCAKRGLVLVFMGSRVLMTMADTGFITCVPPQNYTPDIDLAVPGSWERLCAGIESIWLRRGERYEDPPQIIDDSP